jgi:hypothetical protein
MIGGSNAVLTTRHPSSVHTGEFACLNKRFAQFPNPEAISATTENPVRHEEFPGRNTQIDAG